MARIRLLGGREAPVLLRLFNWLGRRMYGQEVVPAKILAHNPQSCSASSA